MSRKRIIIPIEDQITPEDKFDVVAVKISDSKVSIWYRDKDHDNAEAIIMMGIARRGVDEQFYSMTRPGMYNEGDVWKGDGLEGYPKYESIVRGPRGSYNNEKGDDECQDTRL